GVTVADLHGLPQRGVRGADAGPAAGRVAGDGDARGVGGDLNRGEDGVRGDVAEGHVRGRFVVDAVGGAAGELGAEHGDSLAEFGAEALAADFEVDAGGAAELGEADQGGDDAVAALLFVLGGEEGEFGDLVDQDHDRHWPQVLAQVPDIGGDLRIRHGDADALLGPDELVDVLHVSDERFEEI